MIFFPNAKINIGLNIISRNQDGYHNIESCFCPIDYHDIIEIKNSKTFFFQTSGIKIPGNKKDNIILKLLKEINYRFNGLEILLHKNIPIGSGLGGGSSNGAFFLLTLNKLMNLKMNKNKLYKIANHLGSDCPFFLKNKISYVTGRGNVLKDIKIDLKNKKIIVIVPNIHISTKIAFDNIEIEKPKYSLLEVLNNEPIGKWRNYIFNDFENYVFKKFKKIKKIKENLYKNGALFSSLTGTGSAVYGIFEKDKFINKNLFTNNLIIETRALQ